MTGPSATDSGTGTPRTQQTTSWPSGKIVGVTVGVVVGVGVLVAFLWLAIRRRSDNNAQNGNRPGGYGPEELSEISYTTGETPGRTESGYGELSLRDGDRVPHHLRDRLGNDLGDAI